MKINLNLFTNTFPLKIFAVLAVVGMMDSLAFSQSRIRFARGKTSKTISGTVNQSGRDYIINGRRGQTMKIKVSSPQDTVSLAVGGTNIGTELNIALSSSSDYEFSVYNNDQSTSRFTLFVSIK